MTRASVWCRKCSCHARCRPEKEGTKEHGENVEKKNPEAGKSKCRTEMLKDGTLRVIDEKSYTDPSPQNLERSF